MEENRLCSFCANPIEPGTGKMFIKRDGTVLYFCKNKCKKNMLHLKRVPRTVKWTKRYEKAQTADVKKHIKKLVKAGKPVEDAAPGAAEESVAPAEKKAAGGAPKPKKKVVKKADGSEKPADAAGAKGEEKPAGKSAGKASAKAAAKGEAKGEKKAEGSR